jgi:hypothetical protein
MRRDDRPPRPRQTEKFWLAVRSSTAPHRIFIRPSRSTYHQTPNHNTTMGVPFDYAPERPEHIDAILNGLDRYNPETTTVFQDYVVSQCENQTYDCYANLALLKL